MKRSYSSYFLADTLWALYDREDQRVKKLEAEHTPPAWEEVQAQIQEQIGQNNLSQEEIDQWILPIKGLEYKKALLIAELQTRVSQCSHSQPLRFIVEPIPKLLERRALEWTLIHIQHFPGVELNGMPDGTGSSLDKLNEAFAKQRPYLQCHWCGSLITPQGKLFKARMKFCHAKDCPDKSDPNPNTHENCCAGEWYKLKNQVTGKLNYLKKLDLSVKEEQRWLKKYLHKSFNECLKANRTDKWEIVTRDRYAESLLFQLYQVETLGDLMELEEKGDPNALEIIGQLAFIKTLKSMTTAAQSIVQQAEKRRQSINPDK